MANGAQALKVTSLIGHSALHTPVALAPRILYGLPDRFQERLSEQGRGIASLVHGYLTLTNPLILTDLST